MNYLFYSNVHAVVNACLIEGKCHLLPRELIECTLSEWFDGGQKRFYFDHVYSPNDKSARPVTTEVIDRYGIDHQLIDALSI